MNKQGAITIPFLNLIYLVLVVVILSFSYGYWHDRITGKVNTNLYTANTVATLYGLANGAPGNLKVSYNAGKPYVLEIKGDRVVVKKDDSETSFESYIIKNGFLSHRDAGLYVNSTVNISNYGKVISVE